MRKIGKIRKNQKNLLKTRFIRRKIVILILNLKGNLVVLTIIIFNNIKIIDSINIFKIIIIV